MYTMNDYFVYSGLHYDHLPAIRSTPYNYFLYVDYERLLHQQRVFIAIIYLHRLNTATSIEITLQ
jgi:hypothetical protein